MKKKDPALTVHWGMRNELFMISFLRNREKCFIHIEQNPKTKRITMLPFGGDYTIHLEAHNLTGPEHIGAELEVIMDKSYTKLSKDLQEELNHLNTLSFRVLDPCGSAVLKR